MHDVQVHPELPSFTAPELCDLDLHFLLIHGFHPDLTWLVAPSVN